MSRPIPLGEFMAWLERREPALEEGMILRRLAAADPSSVNP
jgi:hypothetical protein